MLPLLCCGKISGLFAEAVRWRLAKRTVWNAGFGQGEAQSEITRHRCLSIHFLLNMSKQTGQIGFPQSRVSMIRPMRRIVVALVLGQLERRADASERADALEMLGNMEHRGGCGCEPNTGDGAGILVGLPEWFCGRWPGGSRRGAARERAVWRGIGVPAQGRSRTAKVHRGGGGDHCRAGPAMHWLARGADGTGESSARRRGRRTLHHAAFHRRG